MFLLACIIFLIGLLFIVSLYDKDQSVRRDMMYLSGFVLIIISIFLFGECIKTKIIYIKERGIEDYLENRVEVKDTTIQGYHQYIYNWK